MVIVEEERWLDPETWVQPPGDVVKCGNRKDLVKKQRRHWYLRAGVDVRSMGEFMEPQLAEIRICERCGFERVSRKPSPEAEKGAA
jgi:hypothetical protein